MAVGASRSRARGRLQRLRPVLLFAAALAGPLLFLGLLRAATDTDLPGVAIESGPVLAPAVPQAIDGQQRVSLTLSWEEGRVLRAPGWHGTVTSILASSGESLTGGSPMLAVDGITRIAWHGQTPFYRPLSEGASGPDVAELHRLLMARGHLASEPANAESYTGATSGAVGDLAAALGAEPQAGAFDPAWVVWLPAEPFVLGALTVELADPAPSPGQELGREAPRLREARLQPASQSESLAFEPTVAYVLAVGAGTFEVDETTSLVPSEALPALAVELEPLAESTLALIRRESVLQALAVPSTALTSNAAGQLCVWVPAGGGYEPRAVDAVSSRAGVTNITSQLGEGLEVLANPSEILDDTSCPSR